MNESIVGAESKMNQSKKIKNMKNRVVKDLYDKVSSIYENISCDLEDEELIKFLNKTKDSLKQKNIKEVK